MALNALNLMSADHLPPKRSWLDTWSSAIASTHSEFPLCGDIATKGILLPPSSSQAAQLQAAS